MDTLPVKLPRIASIVATAAIAPAVLLSSPAFAADAAAATPSSPATPDQGAGDRPTSDKAADKPAEDPQAAKDRATIEQLLANPATGPGVREAATKALQGTAEQMRHFVTVEWAEQQHEDDEVLI